LILQRRGIKRETLGGKEYRHEASTQAVTADRSARNAPRTGSQGVLWKGSFDMLLLERMVWGEGECGAPSARARVRWMGQQRDAYRRKGMSSSKQLVRVCDLSGTVLFESDVYVVVVVVVVDPELPEAILLYPLSPELSVRTEVPLPVAARSTRGLTNG